MAFTTEDYFRTVMHYYYKDRYIWSEIEKAFNLMNTAIDFDCYINKKD